MTGQHLPDIETLLAEPLPPEDEARIRADLEALVAAAMRFAADTRRLHTDCRARACRMARHCQGSGRDAGGFACRIDRAGPAVNAEIIRLVCFAYLDRLRVMERNWAAPSARCGERMNGGV